MSPAAAAGAGVNGTDGSQALIGGARELTQINAAWPRETTPPALSHSKVIGGAAAAM